jgi:hypothetical protein
MKGNNMTQFLSVAPINILTQLHKLEPSRARSELLLAHDIVQNSHSYYEEYTNRKWMPAERIILDNSAYELKAGVDSKMVWDAIDLVSPTCVVLPDVFLDGPATLDATLNVAKEWTIKRSSKKIYNQLEFMVIPQGETFEAWCTCAEKMSLALTSVSWVGIPRNMVDHLGVSRVEGVRIARRFFPHAAIHLFGFSRDLIDDLVTAGMPEVSSIDSTTPLRLGSIGQNFRFSLKDAEIPPRGDWWSSAEWNDKILTNLQYARRVL